MSLPSGPIVDKHGNVVEIGDVIVAAFSQHSVGELRVGRVIDITTKKDSYSATRRTDVLVVDWDGYPGQKFYSKNTVSKIEARLKRFLVVSKIPLDVNPMV